MSGNEHELVPLRSPWAWIGRLRKNVIIWNCTSRESAEGGIAETRYMFGENDSTAIKSSAIDSPWTVVIQNIQIYIQTPSSHEVRAS